MSALEDIKNLKQFDKIIARIKEAGGIPNPKKWEWLGGGAYGNAYSIGNGLALKITRSDNEIRQAQKLKGKKYKYLYKVIDAFGYKDKKVQNNCIFYGCDKKEKCLAHNYHYTTFHGFVITPKYEKLSKKERNKLNTALDYFYPSCYIKTWRDVQVEVGNAYLKKEALDRRLKKIKAFNLEKMAYDIAKSKVVSTDIHCGNVLKKKSGVYVLIDLTC